jgi:putative SOS response-associated peptidase YedK
MCGRFTNQYTWRELVDLYRITEPYIRPISNLEPRFNFAPMQRGPVVRLDKEGRREPAMMRWEARAELVEGQQGQRWFPERLWRGYSAAATRIRTIIRLSLQFG